MEKKRSYSFIRRLRIIKMHILHKLIYISAANSVKIPVGFLTRVDKLSLKFMWKSKGPR